MGRPKAAAAGRSFHRRERPERGRERASLSLSSPRFLHHFSLSLSLNFFHVIQDGVPALACLETLDSPKLASKLDAAVGAALATGLRPAAAGPLAVMVQVNTSGEESKHGVVPSDAPALALHVASTCLHLRLAGLMTIGQPDYTSRPENFDCLARTREAVVAALAAAGGNVAGNALSPLELSMGMSGDFEAAISMGSTNVRVGSTIFGAREYAK